LNLVKTKIVGLPVDVMIVGNADSLAVNPSPDYLWDCLSVE